MSHADARFDADGWRYGVRFSDGSIAAYWNGSTQRLRAEEYLEHIYQDYGQWPTFDPSKYALVRHRDGEPWQVVQHEG